jgi:hypothetical protein
MNTLDTIEQLRKALRPQATLKEAEAWWDLYRRLDNDLLIFDKRTSKYEREVLGQLKNGLSHATRMIREGQRDPDLLTAQVALSALENSIKRRTTGPDGWPLKG